MKASTVPRLSPVASFADLLAAMPAVLGYRPRDSIVVVWCEHRRVVVTVRLDMDWFVDSFDVVADQLNAVNQRYADARVFALGYSDDLVTVDASLREVAGVIGEVADLLVTNGRRWWSLCCTTGCCPPEGRPFSFDDSPVGREAVRYGIPIARERDELIERVAGPSPEAAQTLRERVERCQSEIAQLDFDSRIGELMRLRANFRGSSGGISVAERVRAAVLLSDPGVSNDLLVQFGREMAVQDTEWLLEVCSECVAELAPNVLGLLAVAAWLRGGGPVVTATVQRLRDVCPGHPMLRMVGSLMNEIIPPSAWEKRPGETQLAFA